MSNRFYILSLFLMVFWSASKIGAVGRYVAPDGDDSYPGSIDKPFFTVAAAVAVAMPGDTIYLRGGTYNYKSITRLQKSGTSSTPISIIAYPGEKPVLDYSQWKPATKLESDSSRAFFITGDNWYIRGIEIRNAPDNGIKIEGSNNTIVACIFHHNGDSGLQIGLGKNDTNDGTKAANNLIVNCDSYRNFDTLTNGGNADGFACKLSPGKGNSFFGCRSWENADDGFDFYHGQEQIVVDRCITWHNGDATLFGVNPSDWRGNGQGFKMGDGNAPHLIKNSVAFDHAYTDGNNKGFDQNSNEGPVTVLNCTGWANEINYYFGSGNAKNVLKNNVGFAWKIKDVSIVAESEQVSNSWNLTALKVDSADFRSLSVEAAKAPRNSDGSLPNNGFARLVAGSDLIDKGVDAGLPFNGTAPDLGAFEYDPASNVHPSINKGMGKNLLQVARWDNDLVLRCNVSGNQIEEGSIRVYTPSGRCVAEYNLLMAKPGITEVAFSCVAAAGTYFVEWKAPSGNFITRAIKIGQR